MSAWICSHSHITALAVYAVRHKLTNRSAAELGEILYEENCQSVDYRYQEYNERDFVLCEWASFHPFSAAEIYKSAGCYGYQSCEHGAWKHSEAYRLTNAIEAHVLQVAGITENKLKNSPAYDEAPWGIDAPQDSQIAA